MNYIKIWELVKKEIESRDIPKESWVWKDYLDNYDYFLFEIERTKREIEAQNLESEEDIAEYISDQLASNYTWSEFEQCALRGY